VAPCFQVNASRITGGLSGELQVSKSTGQTFEEQLTWSVDSQVKVEGMSRAVAALMIREEELNMDMAIESTVTARRDHIPVYIRCKKSGLLVKRLGIPSRRLANILSESEGFQKIRDCSVMRETRGVVRLVYGAEQVIDLKTEPIGSNQCNAQPEKKHTPKIDQLAKLQNAKLETEYQLLTGEQSKLQNEPETCPLIARPSQVETAASSDYCDVREDVDRGQCKIKAGSCAKTQAKKAKECRL